MWELRRVQGSGSLEDRQDDPRVRLIPVGSCAPPMSMALVCVDATLPIRLADQLRAASYIGEIRAGSIEGLLSYYSIRDGYRPDLVLLAEGRAPFTLVQQQALDQLLKRLGANTHLVPVLHCTPEGVESGATTLLGRTESDPVRCDLLAHSPRSLAAVQRRLLLQYSRHPRRHAIVVGHSAACPDASFLSAAACAIVAARYAAGTDSGGLLLLDIEASSIVVCAAFREDLSYKVLSGMYKSCQVV